MVVGNGHDFYEQTISRFLFCAYYQTLIHLIYTDYLFSFLYLLYFYMICTAARYTSFAMIKPMSLLPHALGQEMDLTRIFVC